MVKEEVHVMGTRIVKTGYIRVISGDMEQVISFGDFYELSDIVKEKWRRAYLSGKLHLFCACSKDNNLPLQITANYCVRVAQNGNQELHQPSCPKSIAYHGWIAQTGQKQHDETGMSFLISLPAIYTPPQKELSEEEKEIRRQKDKARRQLFKESGIETEHRTKLLDMVKNVNFYAWQQQQYSIKKELKNSYRECRDLHWNYKSSEEFLKLFFGVSKQISIEVSHEFLHLYDICYRPSLFYQSANDYRYFMCAEIERVSTYKEERKYQYVTVKMPCNKSAKRSVVRIPTQVYDKMSDVISLHGIPQIHVMLAGYIYHSLYPPKDGDLGSEWISMIKGIAYLVDDQGLYVEDQIIAGMTNEMCRKHVLFTRPSAPLQNYGGYIPTIQIERLRNRNILIDFVEDKDLMARQQYCENNPEYEVYVYSKMDMPKSQDILNLINMSTTPTYG